MPSCTDKTASKCKDKEKVCNDATGRCIGGTSAMLAKRLAKDPTLKINVKTGIVGKKGIPLGKYLKDLKKTKPALPCKPDKKCATEGKLCNLDTGKCLNPETKSFKSKAKKLSVDHKRAVVGNKEDVERFAKENPDYDATKKTKPVTTKKAKPVVAKKPIVEEDESEEEIVEEPKPKALRVVVEEEKPKPKVAVKEAEEGTATASVAASAKWPKNLTEKDIIEGRARAEAAERKYGKGVKYGYNLDSRRIQRLVDSFRKKIAKGDYYYSDSFKLISSSKDQVEFVGNEVFGGESGDTWPEGEGYYQIEIAVFKRPSKDGFYAFAPNGTKIYSEHKEDLENFFIEHNEIADVKNYTRKKPEPPPEEPVGEEGEEVPITEVLKIIRPEDVLEEIPEEIREKTEKLKIRLAKAMSERGELIKKVLAIKAGLEAEEEEETSEAEEEIPEETSEVEEEIPEEEEAEEEIPDETSEAEEEIPEETSEAEEEETLEIRSVGEAEEEDVREPGEVIEEIPEEVIEEIPEEVIEDVKIAIQPSGSRRKKFFEVFSELGNADEDTLHESICAKSSSNPTPQRLRSLEKTIL